MINRRQLLAAGTALALAGRAAGQAGESIQFRRHPNVAGPGLAPRHVDVWLPPGSEDRALPLLLMHDGQNLFEPASAYGGVTWRVAETVMAMVAAGRIEPIMVAGVWNSGARRWGDYVPAALMQRLPPALVDRFNRDGGGPSRSSAYVAFLAETVVPLLRAEHRVKPGRVTVMGSSMGGLASLNALIERPDLFRAAGCLSTHWPVLAPEPAEAAAVTAAITGWLRDRLGAPAGRRLWFDHGDQTLDRFYAPFQQAVDRLLPELGWQSGRDFVTQVYPGAAHNEASWAARLAETFTFLFKSEA